MLRRHPLLGVGPDGFRLAYGLYAVPPQRTWDSRILANSLYLEILADLGLAGAGCFMTAIILAVLAIRTAMRGGRASPMPVSIGVLAAMAALLGHGFVDYSLQSHALFLLCWILCGMLVASFRQRSRLHQRRRRDVLIGIEATAALETRRTGVGNYAAQLVSGLSALDTGGADLDLVLFANRNARQRTGPLASLPGPYGRDHLPVRTLWMQLGLPRSIARLRPDLCHFPNHLAPVLRRLDSPFVVTIHDMAVYRCPRYQPLKTTLIHRALIPAVVRRASLVLTVSESARQDILERLRLPEERVRVVYEGVHAAFHAAPSYSRMQGLRARHGLQAPYILSVGTLEPRKNHLGLIEAYERLVLQQRVPHHLVIAGGPGWRNRALLERLASSGLRDRIHLLGYVDDADLPTLYQGADAFAFPSWYEGFGLPVLEAFACGVPSLISHDPALREIAGAGNALVADPACPDEMAAALHRLLSDDPLRAVLRLRGLRRAREFSWERCAQQTLAVYREATALAPVGRQLLSFGG